ncbi:C45 family autoproteolytic acyltransferase/hydolase [Orrella marina]|uniref:Peptidase C45 n=1 Tax=Orrella marina TaxID=2163011 RepID=A0A2R4XKT5_9BURK|nr:C45 family peptidase [Orrella marina]AWB34415.1 peptidase C45 [Orrella marina]
MSNDRFALAAIELSGTPFEVGQQLGEFGKDVVHRYLVHSESWATVMQWRGHARVQEMARLTRERLPAIWQEIEGLAQGLALPLDDVFLWNCRGDVWAMAPDGCTSVMMPSDVSPRLSHNEDGDPGFAGHCAVATVRRSKGSAFAAFVYPGSIPGHTFTVTDHGLAMTVNNLRCSHVGAGLPRMVLARAVLEKGCAADAIDMLRQLPRAGGFHLALADRQTRQVYSVEFSAHFCSVTQVVEVSVHANHAIHPQTRDYPQVITGSSGMRQIRGQQMVREALEADREVDPVEILTDQDHSRFTIWREDPNDDDRENTVGSADIRIHSDHIEWVVRTRRDGPVSLAFRDAHQVS